MPDLDEQLRTYIDGLADQFTERGRPAGPREDLTVVAPIAPDPQPAAAPERRKRRRVRTLLAAATISVAAAVAALIASNAGDDSLSTDVDIADEPDIGQDSEPDVVESGSGIVVVDEQLYPDGTPFNSGFSVPWQSGTLTFDAGAFPHQLTHTVDGVVVDTIAVDELGIPLLDVQSLVSDGERLAAAGMGEGAYGVMAVTDDLRTWKTSVLVDPTPPGVPDEFVFAPDNAEVTLSEWGWVVIGSPYLIGMDPAYLVSRGLLGVDDEVVSMTVDDDSRRLVVETDSDTLYVSATDLGVADHVLYRSGPSPLGSSAWVAAWSGEPSSSLLALPEGEVTVHGGPSGFYVVDRVHGGPDVAFAATGEGWHPTRPGPGRQTVAAGSLGLVSGGLHDGEAGAEFWLSEDLGESWERVEIRGLEGHSTGLFLDEWPVLESFTRRDAAVDVDGYRVVLTGWFATGDGGLAGARLEDPATGEVLAERTFADFYFGALGFEFVDEAGNVLVEVDAATIGQADFGHVGHTEVLAHDGPRWRVDTTTEPWLAVPIA